jgi:hypothetical protein
VLCTHFTALEAQQRCAVAGTARTCKALTLRTAAADDARETELLLLPSWTDLLLLLLLLLLPSSTELLLLLPGGDRDNCAAKGSDRNIDDWRGAIDVGAYRAANRRAAAS